MGDLPYNEHFVHKGRIDPNKGTPDLYHSPRNRGRRHQDWSHNEVYGSQYQDDGYRKIGLQETSHFQKERQINHEFKKIPITSKGYGQFYQERTDNTGRRSYHIDQTGPSQFSPRYGYTGPSYQYRPPMNAGRSDPLPPITTSRGSEASYAYRDRDTYGHKPGREDNGPRYERQRYDGDRYPAREEDFQPSKGNATVNLSTIKQIEVQLKTSDKHSNTKKDNTIYLYPGEGCRFGTLENNNYFTLPEVTELTLKIEDLDGTYSITTIPK